MLGSLILYLERMRIMMFQLSGFYYRVYRLLMAVGQLRGVWDFPCKGSAGFVGELGRPG